jgi:hypothetical protein
MSYRRIQTCCLNPSDHSAALDGVVQSAMDILDVFKAGVSTRLTFQVTEQSGERHELFVTLSTLVKAVVDPRFVNGRIDMRVQ